MLESSGLYRKISQSADWGIELKEAAGFSFVKMMSRKNAIVDRLHRGIEYLLDKNRVEVRHGTGSIRARLADGYSVAIAGNGGEERIETANVILATGSSPIVPPPVKLAEHRIVTSDQIFDLKSMPEAVAILGAGVIGLEFATFFRELGCRVTLIEQLERLLPKEDPEIAKELERLVRQGGTKLLLETRADLAKIDADRNGVRIPVRSLKTGETSVEEAELLLIAVGRKNAVAGLGLEALGVDISNGHVPVSPYMETSLPGLYAIGDITGSWQLAHVAAHQGIIAADRIAGAETEPYREELVPRCVYTHPQIACIGWTERQATERGYRVKTGKFPFRAIGRAVIHGDTEGFVKLVCEMETGQILGVHIIGKDATELIGEFSLGMLLETTAWEVSSAVHPHPALVEIFGEAALAAEGKAING